MPNAVLLCAGLGTRLRPLTNTIPKPMLPVANKPLLQYTIERLVAAGFTNLFINLHYMPNQVKNYFGNGLAFGCYIEYLMEPVLLGSAGTIRALRSDLSQGGDFLVWYGDNYAELDVLSFWQYHQRYHPLMTIALHWREEVSQSGVVEQNEFGQIYRFTEKPQPPFPSHWVNAGIYACQESVLNLLLHTGFYDFGYHLIPELLASDYHLMGYRMNEYVLGIDTPATYTALCQYIAQS